MKKSPLDPEIGHRIAQIRSQTGLTQAQFAELLDVSQGLVSAWESRSKSPGTAKLRRLAEVTGVSMDYIMRGGSIVRDSIKLTDPEEIRLVLSYRSLPERAKKNAFEMIDMVSNVGRVQNKKNSPIEVD